MPVFASTRSSVSSAKPAARRLFQRVFLLWAKAARTVMREERFFLRRRLILSHHDTEDRRDHAGLGIKTGRRNVHLPGGRGIPRDEDGGDAVRFVPGRRHNPVSQLFLEHQHHRGDRPPELEQTKEYRGGNMVGDIADDLDLPARRGRGKIVSQHIPWNDLHPRRSRQNDPAMRKPAGDRFPGQSPFRRSGPVPLSEIPGRRRFPPRFPSPSPQRGRLSGGSCSDPPGRTVRISSEDECHTGRVSCVRIS